MSDSSRSDALNKRVVTFYALPGLATALPTLPILVLLPQFYAGQTALTLSAIGVALLIARLFDMVTDPLAGWTMDRFPTRWGRRKPWMVAGALLCGPALLWLAVPDPSTSLLELTALLCLLYAGWTLFTIPYNALGAELSPKPSDRTRLAAAREGAVILGITLASSLPILLVWWSVSEADHFLFIVIVTLVVGAVAIFACLYFVPERSTLKRLTPDAFPLRSGFGTPVKTIFAAWFSNNLANGIGTVLFPFFLTDFLKCSDMEKAVLIFTYFGAAICGLPLWLHFSSKFQRKHLWLASICIVSVTFCFVPFLPEQAVLSFGVVCLITGVCLGADLALPAALFADVTDWDQQHVGFDRRGSLYAIWMLISKLGLALAAGVSLPLLAWFGFSPNATNEPTSLTALATIYAIGPVTIKLFVIALILGWMGNENEPSGKVIRRHV